MAPAWHKRYRPISSATEVADRLFSRMKRAVCSLISGEYFELLLGMVCVSFHLYAYGSRDHS